MDNGLIPAGMDGMAAAIRREHEACGTAARAALDHAIECGRLLAEARRGIPHGGWESFVRDRCGIAPRTARLYVQLDTNRARLANRQHVADLTVRKAAQLLAEPKAEISGTVVGEPKCLGPYWLKLTSVSAEFNPGWTLTPQSPTAKNSVAQQQRPAWYVPGFWHRCEHESGWSFEVSPDRHVEGRVNAVAHDPTGTVHLACFDGMSPAGILPFMAACERHHAMPKQSGEWKVSAVEAAIARDQLMPLFPFKAFQLASGRHHACYCWALVDEAIGITSGHSEPGYRAWCMFGRTVGLLQPAE